MNTKRRIYQVAKEFNISNEALIGYLQKLNFPVRNQMTLVTEEMYQEACKKFRKEAASTDATYEFRKKLREKEVKKLAKEQELKRQLEERIKVATELTFERPGVRDYILSTKLQEQVPEKKLTVTVPEQEIEVLTPATTKPMPEEELSIKTELPEIKETKIEIEPKIEVEPEPEKKKRKKKKKKKKKPEEKILEDEISKTEEVPEQVELELLEEVQKKKKKKRKRKRKERAWEEPLAAKEERVLEKGKKKTKKKKKIQITEEEVEESIRQTLAIIEESGRPKKKKKKIKEKEIEEKEAGNVIRVNEFISAAELADLMDVEPNEVIKKCLQLGMIVSINQRLDMETIMTVADEFGYEVEIIPEYGEDIFEEIEEQDEESQAVPRPPVVTIMGHVDHGKTSLLDYIHESNIIAGEAGGMTQHIGAYEVSIDGKAITFLDTPGHEAFTAMRARGAQVTDIVVLVVAADDSVMPQTIEAINHAKAAGVPIIVAINKIDKHNANPELIRKQLAENGVLVESWGGKYQSVEISAKTGQGINRLLEMILLEAEILELKANPNRLAKGVVIEAKLDKGKGVVATVLVQKGTLKIGDPFIAGQYNGKVRNLFDERGNKVREARPSQPVQVVGFSGMPQAGDTFIVLSSEKDTREISLKRQQLRREQDLRRIKQPSLEDISRRIKEGAFKELLVIVKGDVDGSVEALSDSLMKLSNTEVAVKVIHKGVGAISESDVLLASASNAIVIGFHVRPTLKARELAQKENVDIRLYTIIYDAISDVRNALEGLLEPELTEEVKAVIEVRETFRIPKVGTVAGCYVLSGKIARNDKVKLYRDDKLVYEGRINSLKRFKEDVKEVAAGFECGIGFDGFDDIKVNDIIEAYKVVQIKRALVT